MQNTLVNAMFLSTAMKDMPSRKTTKAESKSGETFMDLLDSRIQENCASDRKMEKPLQKIKLSFRKQTSEPNSNKAGNTSELKEPETPEDQKISDEKSKEALSGKEGDVVSKADKASGSKAAGKLEENSETEGQETAASLESILAFLEELLAQLNTAAPEDSAANGETQAEQTLALIPEGANTQEIIKQLLEDGFESIGMLLKTGEKLTPELESLLKNLQKNTNITEEMQTDSTGLIKIALKAGDTGTSSAEIIDRIKDQCADTIKELKAEITVLQNQAPQELNTDILEVKPEADISLSLPETEGAESNEPDALKPEPKKEAQSEELPEPQSDLKTKSGKEPENAPKIISGNNSKAEPKAEDTGEKTVREDLNVKGLSARASTEGTEPGITDFTAQMGQQPVEQVTANTEKISLPLSGKPLAETVTNQVMMRVKLMSGENKQEMEINLKPESMGKMSLRIIHERGEVLAKITAENEQVKGILESNMQLLKDSLEKSGFSVQSLSVSVGNGQERNRFGQNTEENGRAYAKGLTNKQNASSVTGTLDVSSRIVRDYYGQNSQIDLTA